MEAGRPDDCSARSPAGQKNIITLDCHYTIIVNECNDSGTPVIDDESVFDPRDATRRLVLTQSFNLFVRLLVGCSEAVPGVIRPRQVHLGTLSQAAHKPV